MSHPQSSEHPDNPVAGARRTDAPTLADLIEVRLSRRAALRAGAALLAGAAAAPLLESAAAGDDSAGRSFTFEEIAHGYDEEAHVPPGYALQVLIRWGDAVLSGAPAFDVAKLTADGQEKQFGYNNDFIAFMPLPRPSAGAAPPTPSSRGLLCVNHEYTLAKLMFPAGPRTEEQAGVEQAAHGHSVVEVRLEGDQWRVVADSPYARRISARSTPIQISGPAAGHARLQTSADPAGREVIGMLNNCAGGVTPWGTVLTAEENFNFYFAGTPSDAREKQNHLRYEVGLLPEHVWHQFQKRFDLAQEPREANRFGWIVEFDPYDPKSTPVKRTALGRFKHEGAGVATAPDGRLALYLGDDSKFEYLYRFVTTGPWHRDDAAANRHLLDEGTLAVAQLAANGTLRWLPLVFGEGPLTPENGFHSQADVLIETRRAADLLKATPLDRPEDIEVSPTTGRVYVMLSNNVLRVQPDAGSPRAVNKHGHVLELLPPGGDGQRDHSAAGCEWNILLQGGNPALAADGAQYGPDVSANGWLSCPDNAAFDPRGGFWIATDGAPVTSKIADGLYACQTTGSARARTRLFFASPKGAEVTGPCFTPDGATLFVSVQHPGGDDLGSTFETPSTRWPDFRPDMPPRPSVVAIRRKDGGAIGT